MNCIQPVSQFSRFLIVIDGPSGAGKTTLARRLSSRLDAPWMNSGAYYRAIGLAVLESGVGADDSTSLLSFLDQIEMSRGVDNSLTLTYKGQAIAKLTQSPEVAEMASKVATVKSLRSAVVERLRCLKVFPKLIVEGRDLGTIVFPEADLKLFLTADINVRINRQLSLTDGKVEPAGVAAQIHARDHRDMTRRHAPLIPANDALVLDTTFLTVNEVEETALREIQQTLSE